MKKIINGKLYDTDKAKQLGSWENPEIADRLNYVEEALYRKKTGEFFLWGSGGANTKYATYTGSDHWSGGEMIIPLTYDEARRWAEKRLSADQYEEIFGEIVDDGEHTSVTLYLSSAAAERAKRAAAQAGISLSAYIESRI